MSELMEFLLGGGGEMFSVLLCNICSYDSQIEESILDRLAWEEHSPLYDALHNAGDIVPSCESVCFAPSAHGDTSAGTHVSVSALSSPVLHRNIYKIAGDKVIGYREWLYVDLKWISRIVLFIVVSFKSTNLFILVTLLYIFLWSWS